MPSLIRVSSVRTWSGSRDRGPGVTLAQVAADFEVHEMTLSKWLRQADVEDGVKPRVKSGVTSDAARELRELKRRNRPLEQENEVLRRATAYLSQAQLPGKALPTREGVGRRRAARHAVNFGSINAHRASDMSLAIRRSLTHKLIKLPTGHRPGRTCTNKDQMPS